MTQLLVTAVTLLATNIVTFGLLYWQIDGGGPDARQVRCRALSRLPVPPNRQRGTGTAHWQPRFPDYLYVAFTNVVALSPTDTSR